MKEDMEIPEELKPAFKRIMKRMPGELVENSEFKMKALLYLKLGGEKLVRQRIEITQKQFREEYIIFTPLVTDEDDDEIVEDKKEPSAEEKNNVIKP